MPTNFLVTPCPSPPLADLVQSPDYAGRVAALASGLQHAQDEHQALEVFADTITAMGMDAAAFVSFVQEDDSHESFRFLLACDPIWCCEYERRAWYASDPWLAYALTNSEPCEWLSASAVFWL